MGSEARRGHRLADAVAVDLDPLAHERMLWDGGARHVAGIDEVGRGPLAGPVVAAAVILPRDRLVDGAADSKVLGPEERAEICARIREIAVAIGVGAASCREIERINILRASGLAMRRAVRALGVEPQHLLVDGLPVAELGMDRQTALVGGDGRCHAISCASIVAKVVRDHLMRRLDPRYPRYGWTRNKGYSTPEHLEALREHGPTPHHRRSFAPVAQLQLC